MTARNGYIKYTNDFTLTSICPGLNVLSIKSSYSYIISETFTAGAMTTVLKNSDYVKFTSCSPTSYTLLDAYSGTAYPLSTEIRFSTDGTLSVSTMVAKTHSLII